MQSAATSRPPTANAESPTIDAAVDQRQLGGAAADIDMQDAGVARLGQRHRARAMRGEPAFELVAGGGADELAGFAGEQLVDGAGIFALDRLAGEDDRAAVDIALGKAGVAVAAGG